MLKHPFFTVLLYLVTFSADVVPWREKYWAEPKNQLTKKASFGILENFNPFQSVQMNVDSNFAFQFICKKIIKIGHPSHESVL